MAMDNEDIEAFKPPYMSFHTFWNFTRELGTKPLPPRIDRSIMAGKSGTDQANLFLALASFGLIDQDANVLPLLEKLTSAEEEQRKALLAEMVQGNYVEPMRVSASNGTAKDLDNAFRDNYPSIASPDTRRKATTFFLHAAKTAGLELSVHFPKTRSGPGAPGIPRAKKAARRKPTPPSGAVPSPPQAGAHLDRGDRVEVKFGSQGTFVGYVDVRWLDLPGETFAALRKAIEDIKALGYEDPASLSAEQNNPANKNGPSEEGPSGQPPGDGGGVT